MYYPINYFRFRHRHIGFFSRLYCGLIGFTAFQQFSFFVGQEFVSIYQFPDRLTRRGAPLLIKEIFLVNIVIIDGVLGNDDEVKTAFFSKFAIASHCFGLHTDFYTT